MVTPDIDIYFRVDITFKALSSSESTQSRTLSFIDRPYPDSETVYIPALLDLSGLGIGVGQSGLPIQSVGSIILNDNPGSLGYDRRVSDLLSRYTVADQTIIIYASQVGLGEAPSFEQVWSGRGVNANKSAGADETLTISCKSVAIPVRPVLRAILESECTSISQNSIGRFPSIPIGSAPSQLNNLWPCVAYPVRSASHHASAAYSLGATAWSSRFTATYGMGNPRGNTLSGWARCHDGKYRSINSGVGSLPATGHSNVSGFSAITTATDGKERAVLVTPGSGVITGGRFWFLGQNDGGITPSGNLIFKLYLGADSSGSTRPDSAHLAIAVVDKADYLSEVRGASDFWVYFNFSEPFVFGGEAPGAAAHQNLHLSCTIENFTTELTDFVPGNVDSGASGYWQRDENNEWILIVDYTPAAAVYKMAWFNYTYQPDSYSQDGLRYKATDFFQKMPVKSGQTAASLEELDVLIGLQGIIDTTTPEDPITGTAAALLQSPHHVLEAFSRKWGGSSWVSDPIFDWNTYSTAYLEVGSIYPRLVAGVITQDSTTEDVMGLIARQHRYSIIQDADGAIAAWPTGYTAEVSAVIDSEESIVTGWNLLEPETVINNVKIYYGENILNTQAPVGTGSSGFEGYVNSLDFAVDLPSIHSLGVQSQALFGKRELGTPTFNLIGDSTTAQNVGDLTYRQFDLPHWIVGITIPFWKYRSLRLMDVIEITSPSLPSFFGTSEAANLPIYDGDYVEAHYGEYPKRAQRYRCQIIQKNLEYQAGTIPTWNLTVRIISPYHPNEVT